MEQNEDNPTQHSLKLVWNSLDIHPFLVVLIFTCFLDLFGLTFTSLLVASQHLNMSRQYIFFLSPLCVGQIRNYSIFPHKKAKETTWSHFPWQKNMFSFISTQKTPRSFQWCQPSFLHVACAHVAGQRQPPYHRLLRLRLEIKLFAAAAGMTIPKSRKYDGFVVITL